MKDWTWRYLISLYGLSRMLSCRVHGHLEWMSEGKPHTTINDGLKIWCRTRKQWLLQKNFMVPGGKAKMHLTYHQVLPKCYANKEFKQQTSDHPFIIFTRDSICSTTISDSSAMSGEAANFVFDLRCLRPKQPNKNFGQNLGPPLPKPFGIDTFWPPFCFVKMKYFFWTITRWCPIVS